MLEKPTKPRRRWWRIIGLTLLGLILLGSIGLAVIAHDPALAATFTDNVLRPMIGDQNVIALERVIFGLQDRVNQVKNLPPDTSTYTAPTAAAPLPVAAVAPTNLVPYIDTAHPLTDEGVWKETTGGQLFTTFIRTDPERPYSVVNLVYIPLKKVAIGEVAGQKHPGGKDRPGPGKVPAAIQDSGKLLAAFNGGFLEKDGHYGMIADGVTYQPLRNGLTTIFIYKDGQAAFLPYTGGAVPADVASARQNGPLLVSGGKTMATSTQGIDMWAGTAKGGYVTWRSGLGETTSGDLLYAVGPSLVPTSLADALRLGGAQTALQLDINAFWVRFMLFTHANSGYTWTPLVKDLTDGGKAYLNGYEKDFFYVYQR